MKVLVTGSMGFIGSNLIPYLLNNGCEVIGIDNLLNPSLIPTDRMKEETNLDRWPLFKFWNCDIRDLQNLYSIFVNEKPDIVVHLAALGSVMRSWDQPGLVTDINERGFANVLQAATAIKVKKFIFASSSSVYGPSEKNVKWEGSSLCPQSPYALTKVANERFANLWCGYMGLEYIGLRFFNVYGPGQSPYSEYAAVIPRFFINPEITVYGDGSTIRDFTFVGDVAKAIFRCMTTPIKNDLMNVGTGQGTSLNTLAVLIKNLEGKEVKYLDPRPGDIKISIADTAKIENNLGMKKFTPLKEGLEITKRFYDRIKKYG